MASEQSVIQPETKTNFAEVPPSSGVLLRTACNPFLGTSSAIRHLENQAIKLVNGNGAVLIQGEPGCGKGVLARWLHESSPRSNELLVELQCSGISQQRIEAKLFGCEKGAFGAQQAKPGLLEIAQGGSVFIEEISELDLFLQEKILKVLEEKKFCRVGDTTDREADVRIIASSRHNLAHRVEEGRFRDDLYAHFATPFTIPPLRERIEDVAVLAASILRRISDEQEIGPIHLSGSAMQALQSFSWPGNIRELRNTLDRAVLLSGSQNLSKEDLQFDLTVDAGALQLGSVRTLEEVERQYIQKVLWLEGGRVQIAAKKLGIPRSSLYHKLKQYGISPRLSAGQINQNAASA